MYAFARDHILHYRISQDTSGVRLTVWEIASRQAGRLKPYLYVLNYSFNTPEEAQLSLKRHLRLNGVSSITDGEIPNTGKIRIMPHPTWSSCEILPQSPSVESPAL